MNSGKFNLRRVVAGCALALLALAIFGLVRWIVFAHDDAAINVDDLTQAQTDQPAGAGHSRLSASQAAEIPLSSQFQLKAIIAASEVEDQVAVITEIGSSWPDQHRHLGEQLRDGSVLRELFPTFAIIDKDGRLERVPLKGLKAGAQSNQGKDKAKADQQQEAEPPLDKQAPQELPRAGLAPKSATRLAHQPEQRRTNTQQDKRIADSAKLPAYHLEQRNRMIVPQAPDASVLDTPERSVPKAQGNRLPTASYTPPQS